MHLSRETVINWLWVALFAILPLGHVTGLRNGLILLVVAGVISRCDWKTYRTIPAWTWLLAFAAFAACSSWWSAQPDLSIGKWRSDLLVPLLGYAGAFLWISAGRSAAPLVLGSAIGMGALLMISLFDFMPPSFLDQIIPQAPFAAVGRTLPQWYPGTGDASLLAVLYAVVLITWVRLRGKRVAWRTSFVVIAALTILAVTKNRSSLLVLPLVGLSMWWLENAARRRALVSEGRQDASNPRWRILGWIVAAGCLIAVPVVAEVFSRARLVELHEQMPASGTAFEKLAVRDVRPIMWRHYAVLGLTHPWLGVGFGRTLPAEVYDVKNDPAFAHTEISGLEHAHNYFLNLWLQMGSVGLGIFLVGIIAMVRRARTLARNTRMTRIAFVAVVGLLITTMLRNMTDDFMVYGTALAVWAQLGLWLGMQQAFANEASQSRAATPAGSGSDMTSSR